MIIDALLLLDDAHAYTATAVCTNSIDLGNPTVKNSIGAGEPMAISVQVDVAADHTTGDETYQLDLLQSANADLSSPDVLLSRVLLFSQLTAGAIVTLPIPSKAVTKRYIGYRLTAGGTTPTVTLTAQLQPHAMIDEEIIYAKGYNV